MFDRQQMPTIRASARHVLAQMQARPPTLARNRHPQKSDNAAHEAQRAKDWLRPPNRQRAPGFPTT
jgi:hypothetical protein